MAKLMRLSAAMFFCLFLSFMFIFMNMKGMEVNAEICKPGEHVEGTVNGDRSIDFSCKPPVTIKDPQKAGEETGSYFKTVAYILIGVSTGVSVVMIAYAAILYTTSGGHQKLVREAKLQLLAAGVGLLIAASSFLIFNMVMAIVKL